MDVAKRLLTQSYCSSENTVIVKILKPDKMAPHVHMYPLYTVRSGSLHAHTPDVQYRALMKMILVCKKKYVAAIHVDTMKSWKSSYKDTDVADILMWNYFCCEDTGAECKSFLSHTGLHYRQPSQAHPTDSGADAHA